VALGLRGVADPYLRVRGGRLGPGVHLGDVRLSHVDHPDEGRRGARGSRAAEVLLQRRGDGCEAPPSPSVMARGRGLTWWRWARWVVANRAWSHHHVLGYLRMVR